MDKQQAQRIIKDTFENPFDKARFTSFILNLLNHIERSEFSYQGNIIPDSFKEFISRYERLGKYYDEKNRIDILIVYLNRKTSIDRARTNQRNFIAGYLQGRYGSTSVKDAALVAYVAPDQADWRFSLVRMDYTFEKSAPGKIKAIEEFSPARRWSFLVGVNERSHTAQSRLVNILANDEHNPTLSDLENAFDIEKVTREFFIEYRNLFLRTKEALDKVVINVPKIRADFEAKGVDTVNFAKKLMGQIVFLYFLQKKGWFGVGRDDDWGTGSKHFLRELFKGTHGGYSNFFNDILEPLFYEALRTGKDREHEDFYYSRFNCKIPFLNGGLFDPISGYDWVHTDINLPNELFSNFVKTKDGDSGNGILDIFDRYNFTVREDEPLEKEVAIDPELLGKAYEKFNAIRPDNFDEFTKALKSGARGEENKFNKKFGVYYTPRDIVHYMCRQSLINYLSTKAEESKLYTIEKSDLEDLIEVGELITEHEATALLKQEKIKNGTQNSSDYTLLLSGSIRENALAIDNWLKDITVCDPAVGSGAFPVGMMNEIVRARNVLSVYLNNHERNSYIFKRRCIEHSLYGVDIDPGAVEIAKLRLWLSLVVDEENIKNIKPLPNLDYKIMQGNSLIEMLSSDVMASNDNNRTRLVQNLKKAKDELFNITQPTQKENKRLEINNLIRELIEYDRKKQIDHYENLIKGKKSQVSFFEDEKKQKAEEKKIQEIFSKIKEVESLELPGPTEHFEWYINFSDIFQSEGGFDVAIANPPYLKERDNKRVFQIVNNSDFGKKFHQGKMDYWFYFLHKAMDIVRKDGIISFITSRYWLNSSGAKKLINRIKDELSFIEFIDIGKLKVFDEVAGHHMVAVYQKKRKDSNFRYKKLINDLKYISKNEDTEYIKVLPLNNRDIFTNNEIVLEKPFYDITDTITLGVITEISQGVVEAPDKISNKQISRIREPGFSVGDGVFVLSKNEVTNLNLNNSEKLVLKKYLDPSDVGKYYICFNDKYLIYTNNEIKDKIKNDERYSHLKNHLFRFKSFITSSNKPYGLHRPRESKFFDRPKIIFKNMFFHVGFALDDKENFYFGFSFSAIIQRNEKYNLKYILAILNSRFAEHWFYKYGKERGAGVDIGVEKLRQFPIKKINPDGQRPIINLVNEIFTIAEDENYLKSHQKQELIKAYERQIDQLVYQIYGLTEDKVKIVERDTK